MQPLRLSVTFLFGLVLFLTTGCSERGPVGPFLTVEEAALDNEPRTIRVIKVWDILTDSVTTYRDYNASHLIEVEVIAGRPAPPVWPYSAYYRRGSPLPRPSSDRDRGSFPVVAPCEWIGPQMRTSGGQRGGGGNGSGTDSGGGQ